MKMIRVVAVLLATSSTFVCAQNLTDLNLEIHGYATQGFVYTNQNNWNTTDSSSGSPAWTDMVLNVTAQPDSKLRVGVQGRYFLLGNYDNQITLDWATGDYKFNDHFGVRFGKVKTPTGLFNEMQDIDPVQMWSLLPQSVYPIASRNSVLAHYGGLAYGSVDLNKNLGSVDYRVFGGERVIGAGDGYFQPFLDEGLTIPNGMSGAMFGGAMHWQTPVKGLMLGASDVVQRFSATVTVPVSLALGETLNVTGPAHLVPLSIPAYFGKLEKGHVTVAGEYSRIPFTGWIDLSANSGGLPLPTLNVSSDFRNWYGMSSYRFNDHLSTGVYYSSGENRAVVLGSGRYEKDWTASARYYFNQFMYAKAEQHFMKGTETGFSTSNNINGLKPNTAMTILKVGVTF